MQCRCQRLAQSRRPALHGARPALQSLKGSPVREGGALSEGSGVSGQGRE